MTTRITQIVRDPATGAGVASKTVTVKKVAGGSVGSKTTDAAGRASFTPDDIGDPGPIYAEFDDGSGNTKRHSGEVIGQVGGFLWVDAINDAIAALGSGVVIPEAGDELGCEANGSNMNISVKTGAIVLKDGYVYLRETAGNVAVSASDPTNPRIDRIVLRLTREGQTQQGVVTVVVLKGTPASSPAAPALTQNATTWESSLCTIMVDAGVTAIASNKVTDERRWTLTPPDGLAPGDLLYMGTGGKLARLPKSTDGYQLVLASGSPAWQAASQEITRTAYDDTLRNTADRTNWTDQVTLSMTLPLPGTWTIEAVAMARIATDSGGAGEFRVSVDGANTTTIRTGPSSGAAPVTVRGSKSGNTTSPKTIVFRFRSNLGDTIYVSNAVLIAVAYRS